MTSASSASNLGALAGAAAVRREIHAALETGAFRADCQGIVSLANGDALGFEALTRPASRPPLDTPESFLTAAANEGLLAEVDHTWRVGSIARFGPGFPSERLLFLNVSPLSLLSGHTTAGALESTTRQFGLSPERVVLELTEGEKIDDFDRMRRVLGGFRSRGFLIAIDDAGAGQSSLQSVVELRPDYIKLDRWLSRDIEFDRSRRSMVQALVGFAHQVRARVVAEGIETYEQLDAFIDLGVDFGQGYIFGFPAAIPVPAPPEVQLHIRKKNTTRRRTATDPGIVRMRDLACVTPTVDATTPGDAVFWLFQENSNLDVVAVIDDEGIGGIITRGRIFERMSGQFGLPLNGRRPASELCVAATTVQASIVAAAASHIALTRPPSAQSDPLIVLDGKTYAGVVGMHELLQQLLTEEVAEARLMSPLTGLPGSRATGSFAARSKQSIRLSSRCCCSTRILTTSSHSTIDSDLLTAMPRSAGWQRRCWKRPMFAHASPLSATSVATTSSCWSTNAICRPSGRRFKFGWRAAGSILIGGSRSTG